MGQYFLYLVIFSLGGGIGAGLPSFLFEAITGTDPMAGQDYFLYAVMFGVMGVIACRLALRVIE